MSNETKNPSPEEVKVDHAISIFYALVVLVLGAAIGFFVYGNIVNENAKNPFKLGLDLAGGAHLIYEADTTGVNPEEVPELMSVLRDVIERRVNVFGVSEPIVQVEQSSFVTDEVKQRLVVELPGVTDVDQAIAEIGKTPLLEFKLVDEQSLAAQNALENLGDSIEDVEAVISNIMINGEEAGDPYIDTGLTGRYLKSAALEFAGQNSGGLSNEPIVSIQFDDTGAELFEEITRDNVGEALAIFLDGELLSAPRINEAIVGGTAIISGGFDPEEARALAQNLNFGALPVPIELQSTQTIGASLGAEVLDKGVSAALIGIALVILFMIFWYRLPGLVAGVALAVYVVAMLALFQLIPVTLTAAGLAGFILSIGMAVDANVLVFERMKEEYRTGKNSREAARIGFARAWSAIRDGNVTSILSAIILFWFGTSIVKGFALVFGLGVLVSMLTALSVTRTLLLSLPEVTKDTPGVMSKLFGTGLRK
jgi:protein-export membrane protein SecD